MDIDVQRQQLAIVNEALAPHSLKKLLANMRDPFTIILDESNGKTDKSCIILGKRVLDSDCGKVCTRFLDIPIVNIGNAQNLFAALKESLTQHGINLSNVVAFMSDTTNVMKGA